MSQPAASVDAAGAPADTSSVKHLRKLFLDKFMASVLKRITGTELPESFAGLKGKMDAKSYNILMTMVKEKMEGLQGYAEGEFEGLCAEYDLHAKFLRVEQAMAAAADSSSSSSNSNGNGNGSSSPSDQGEDAGAQSLEDVSPEDLARHRRVAIKKLELAELEEMAEREQELLAAAEAGLKATKDKMRAHYNDLASINPEAQRLLQRCSEN